jgi:transcriptional regulator with XRE-family HTH domain
MNRFRELRKEKHLTQAELIKQYNQRYNRTYSIPALSLFENGRRLPELAALQDFAEFFDVPVDYLLGRSDVRYELFGNTNDPKHPWHNLINKDVEINPPPNYYNDPETQRRMEEMYSDPKRMRIFVASKDLKPEELDRIADLMETIAKSHRK